MDRTRGVSHPLEAAQRDAILAEIPEALRIYAAALPNGSRGRLKSSRRGAIVRQLPLMFCMANDTNEFSATGCCALLTPTSTSSPTHHGTDY